MAPPSQERLRQRERFRLAKTRTECRPRRAIQSPRPCPLLLSTPAYCLVRQRLTSSYSRNTSPRKLWHTWRAVRVRRTRAGLTHCTRSISPLSPIPRFPVTLRAVKIAWSFAARFFRRPFLIFPNSFVWRTRNPGSSSRSSRRKQAFALSRGFFRLPPGRVHILSFRRLTSSKRARRVAISFEDFIVTRREHTVGGSLSNSLSWGWRERKLPGGRLLWTRHCFLQALDQFTQFMRQFMRSCTIVLGEKIAKSPAFHFTNPELRSTLWRCTGDRSRERHHLFASYFSVYNVRSVTSFLSPAHHAGTTQRGLDCRRRRLHQAAAAPRAALPPKFSASDPKLVSNLEAEIGQAFGVQGRYR